MITQPILQNQVDILAEASIIRIGQSLYLVDYVFVYRNADLLLQRLLRFHFITHHDAPEFLRPLLAELVERHITEYSVTSFTVGRYGNFDRMAAGAVKAAKKRHPEVTLSLLLPYHPYDQSIEVPDGFDSTFYPPGMETVPKRVAIVRANQYIIAHSDFLITYNRGYGNTGTLVKVAGRREAKGLIHIENLFYAL